MERGVFGREDIWARDSARTDDEKGRLEVVRIEVVEQVCS